MQTSSDKMLASLDLDDALYAKSSDLVACLRALGRVIVAFSGGVDSSLLAVVAKLTLGRDAVLAATAVSGSLDQDELEGARRFVRDWDLRYLEVATEEFADERYLRNDSMRCYYCKSSLMDQLVPLSESEGARVALGVNLEDLGDYRPGQGAARERGALFPLLEASFTKADVRALAHALGLEVWDKPAAPCLSSRLPYGTPVSISAISKISRAEAAVRRMGYRVVRVRHFGEDASVEVAPEDVGSLISRSDELAQIMLGAGYRTFRVDPEGFRSGRLNEGLNIKLKTEVS